MSITGDHLSQPTLDVKLQACLAEPEGVSEYRFLVAGKDVKYITVEPGVIPPEDVSFEPAVCSCLPAFPSGDWNEGHVVRDRSTGKAVFASYIWRDLPGVKDVWHHVRIDHLQLTWISRMRQNVRVVSCPLFTTPVVYKFAEFPWQIPIIEAESAAYKLIRHHDVGPTFLGHVTEAGRVIGFLMEHIPGRTANIQDLDKCERALKRFHVLGLKHGDANRYNYLIKEGSDEAVLIDLDSVTRCDDEQELLGELGEVRAQLEEDTGRGGEVVLEG